MIKRRARRAGLPHTTCCHTFWATAIKMQPSTSLASSSAPWSLCRTSGPGRGSRCTTWGIAAACLTIKSVIVPAEYWDTGVAVLLIDEMARRAAAKGYRRADLLLTSADNPRTPQLAEHLGTVIYKRTRVYRMWLAGAPPDQPGPVTRSG
jgi:GNAT superfamily N-acetyltransferase